MAFVPYSKRNRPAKDVYTYDALPPQLRVQIIHLWHRMVEACADHAEKGFEYRTYKKIIEHLQREFGILSIAGENNVPLNDALRVFFLTRQSVEECLDVVEIVFLHLGWIEGHIDSKIFAQGMFNEALDELNARFKEHGVGYQLPGQYGASSPQRFFRIRALRK